MNLTNQVRKYFSQKVDVIGAAWSVGQKRPGTEKSPGDLRQAGLLTSLAKNTPSVIRDLGDIELPPEKTFTYPKKHDFDNYPHIGYLNGLLSQAIANTEKDSLTMVLGGDHSLGCGSVHGSLLKHGDDLKVIWIDAHADINTPVTSSTKNYHGMPVGHITGLFEHKNYTGFEWLSKRLKFKNLVYIGIRDLDLPEKEFVANNHIRAYSPNDIERCGGIHNVMNEVFEYLGLTHGKTPVHVSFDVDSADSEVIGGTGTPSRFGLSAREIIYIMRRMYTSGCMVHLDVAEVNKAIPFDKPYQRFHGDNEDIHTDSLTVYNTCEFVHYALGKTHHEVSGRPFPK